MTTDCDHVFVNRLCLLMGQTPAQHENMCTLHRWPRVTHMPHNKTITMAEIMAQVGDTNKALLHDFFTSHVLELARTKC